MKRDQFKEDLSDEQVQAIREWDRQFEDFIFCRGGEPGAHPDPLNTWNTNKRKIYADLGIEWK